MELDREFMRIMATNVAVSRRGARLWHAFAREVARGCDVLVVPAPSSAASLRARGRFQTMPLATAVASELQVHGVPAVVADVLHMTGVTGKSVMQSGSADRARRIKGHVSADGGIEGRVVVLVDDIMTSGATLAECAHAISECGGIPVAAFVLACVPLRNDGT